MIIILSLNLTEVGMLTDNLLRSHYKIWLTFMLALVITADYSYLEHLWHWYSEYHVSDHILSTKLLRRNTDPTQVQLHGSRPGKERALSCPSHLFPRCRWQRHPAQLLRGRCHHPASAWSPWRLALWGEWEEQNVSNIYSFILFFLNPYCDFREIFVQYLCTVNVKFKFNKDFIFLRRGWFPFSYTRVLPESDNEKLRVKYVAVFNHTACQLNKSKWVQIWGHFFFPS